MTCIGEITSINYIIKHWGLCQLSSTDCRNRKDYLDLQNERFQEVWLHIIKTPIYRRKLMQSHIDPRSVKSLKDLGRLPFTCKSDIKALEIFDCTPLKIEDVYGIYSSGGTTGVQTLYPWSEKDILVQTEVAKRIMTQVGIKPSDLGLVIAPLSLPVMGHCMVRQFSAVGAGFIPIGQTDPGEVVTMLKTLPVSVVATLPAVASRLIQYMGFVLQMNIDTQIRVRRLLLGGDSLSNSRRHRLEQAWNARCYDFYGISEIFGPVGGECQYQEGLHFAADYVLVEVLDPETKQPVPEGKPGIAVFTTLWEKAFPLLRYWSDDYITWTWEPCQCGLCSPRMFFLGRPLDCAEIGGRKLFAKEVDDIILKYPIIDDYYCEYVAHDRRPVIKVNIESAQDSCLPVGEISETLEGLFGMPVELKVAAPGTLSRVQAKPKRLVGFPGSP
jgi:phenylacetate-CoA ligase